jgi:hypothetical protein
MGRRGTHPRMAFKRHTIAALLLVLTVPAQVWAARCGDDVEGVRIACACGDSVVSDTRLLPSDPVVAGRCRSDGLIVQAARGIVSLTLDLDGNALTGEGRGTGILIHDGGSDGAILIGGRDGKPGQVAGFRVGVSARGSYAIRAMENLVVVGNESDGVRVSGRGAAIHGVVSDDNGAHGIRARGRDHAIAGVAAGGNGRADVRVSGNGHYVDTDDAMRTKASTRVTGNGNVVAGEVAR